MEHLLSCCDPPSALHSPVTLPARQGRLEAGLGGTLEVRPTASLRPHSLILKYSRPVSLSEIGDLSRSGDAAFHEPVVITGSGEILNGLALWDGAQREGRPDLICRVLSVSKHRAVIWLLQNQQPSTGLNQFTRILIGLELEPWLREQARENQQLGGELKGSSNLTEARHLDVRRSIAQVAGASCGNVTKVKTLRERADPSVMEALKMGEIRIHRAWGWVQQSSDGGRVALLELRRTRQIFTTIRRQMRKSRKARTTALDGLVQIRAGLHALIQQNAGSHFGHHILKLFRDFEREQNNDAPNTAAA